MGMEQRVFNPKVKIMFNKNKFLKADFTEREAYIEKLNKCKEDIEETLPFENLREQIEALVSAYNTVVDDARGWVESIYERMEETRGERSDEYWETETGEAVDSWYSEWESVELEMIEIEALGDLDNEQIREEFFNFSWGAIDTLEELPTEAY